MSPGAKRHCSQKSACTVILLDQRRGIVVRASGARSLDLGFIPLKRPCSQISCLEINNSSNVKGEL